MLDFIFINDGSISKRINPADFSKYEELGWSRGRYIPNTHFLNEIYPDKVVPTGIKKYCSLNNITSIEQVAKCKKETCSNYVKWRADYSNRGFTEYCSETCSRSDKTIAKDTLKLLANKDWLYEQRFTLRKSYDDIANENGFKNVDIIKNALVKHGLPLVRFNESEHTVREALRDRDLLEELYIKENMTCEKIAKEIGSSTAIVANFIRKHGIPIKPSNSYEKKFTKRSKGEIEIYTFITEELGIPAVHNKSSLIKEELDIQVPSKNLAIEYNGLWYHTEDFKGRDHHARKTEKCLREGWTLFHVWEDDWMYKKDIVKSMIRNKLGATLNKIAARKCKIFEISNITAREFLDVNHIQGSINTKINLGLEYEGKLVAVMTLNKPRFNRHYNWELVRYATTLDTNVMGGFSRLLKYFRNKWPGSLITYANLSYSNGGVYVKNGFTLLVKNPPSYWYVVENGYKRASRTMFTKKKLLKIFELEYSPKSEKELAKDLKMPRVWDSGTLSFVIN